MKAETLCQFRLCFNTADGTPISVTGDSSFALCGVEIPCQVAGVSPSLLFDFDACASILNPTLTGAADGTITLSGSLVVTPQVRLESHQTLAVQHRRKRSMYALRRPGSVQCMRPSGSRLSRLCGQ